jgi:hypothetical protein
MREGYFSRIALYIPLEPRGRSVELEPWDGALLKRAVKCGVAK